MAFEDKIKSFGMTNMLIESDLDNLEGLYSIKLRDITDDSKIGNEIEEAYMPQFEQALRNEAREMAKNYELFYCLEKTIRSQISELIESKEGVNWWNNKIIPEIYS